MDIQEQHEAYAEHENAPNTEDGCNDSRSRVIEGAHPASIEGSDECGANRKKNEESKYILSGSLRAGLEDRPADCSSSPTESNPTRTWRFACSVIPDADRIARWRASRRGRSAAMALP